MWGLYAGHISPYYDIPLSIKNGDNHPDPPTACSERSRKKHYTSPIPRQSALFTIQALLCRRRRQGQRQGKMLELVNTCMLTRTHIRDLLNAKGCIHRVVASGHCADARPSYSIDPEIEVQSEGVPGSPKSIKEPSSLCWLR